MGNLLIQLLLHLLHFSEDTVVALVSLRALDFTESFLRHGRKLCKPPGKGWRCGLRFEDL